MRKKVPIILNKFFILEPIILCEILHLVLWVPILYNNLNKTKDKAP